MQRKCFSCKKIKELEEFPKSKREGKGYKYCCKVCNAARGRRYYREVLKKDPERMKARSRRQYLKLKSNPLGIAKITARWKAQNALKAGKLEILPCFKCGVLEDLMNMHHPDYSKPLSIVWFCRKHHTELHEVAGDLERPKGTFKVKECIECKVVKEIFLKGKCSTCYYRKYYMRRRLKKLEND